MTTAVDSNILIDVIGHPNAFTASAIASLDAAFHAGTLVVSPVVVAETAAYFASGKAMREALDAMHLEMRPFGWTDLHRAGETYVAYCRRRPRAPKRMLADFLVAAHAATHSDALLTRDRGYYRNYFSDLRLIEPSR
jgi:predicted nucleic acid-binding protein